jgi:hypothetical protein
VQEARVAFLHAVTAIWKMLLEIYFSRARLLVIEVVEMIGLNSDRPNHASKTCCSCLSSTHKPAASGTQQPICVFIEQQGSRDWFAMRYP